MSKKHKAKEIEFSFTSEAFNLVVETTEDGATTQAWLDAARAAKAKEDEKQLRIDGVVQKP